jgi:hypothetical protein
MFEWLSPIFAMALVALAAYWWQPSFNMSLVFVPAIAATVFIPYLIFATEASPSFTREHSRLGGDIAFLRKFVKDHDRGQRPCVYWPISRADFLWIDVKATSYFSILQTAGVMFNEQTAKEIRQRARFAGKFEMDRERREAVLPETWSNPAAETLFGVKFECPPPTLEDLLELCRDDNLDYVVIPQEFDGLYSATNGRLFVYEPIKVLPNRLYCERRPRLQHIPPGAVSYPVGKKVDTMGEQHWRNFGGRSQ